MDLNFFKHVAGRRYELSNAPKADLGDGVALGMVTIVTKMAVLVCH